MSELKPCPFCGRADQLHVSEVYKDEIVVYCRNCGATGGTRETKLKAVEAWNTRAAERREDDNGKQAVN